MAIAKIIYKENASATPEVWMDTTDKTAAAGNMLSGTTALKNDGTTATGNIATKTSANLSASGATVTAPAGYYASDASKSVASGTEGTPTATKGTVSSHSVTVTPSVTNTAGYISGGTHTGTAVTVSASELVSGTKSITASGTTDVTNYASASVAAGSAATPATSITANPSISVSSGGLITASVSASQNVTPTVSAGYVSSGTAGTVSVSGSNTEQLTAQAATTYHPSTTDQTIASGKYLTGAQTIKAVVTTNLIAANIADGVTVKIGDSTDDDCVASITGTHQGGTTPTGVKYIWTDVDGEGAWDVSGYAMCSVDGAPVGDTVSRLWINLTADTGKTLTLKIWQTNVGLATIDYGDGSPTATESSQSGNITFTHVYRDYGKYIVTLTNNESAISGSYACFDEFSLGQESSAFDYKCVFLELALPKNQLAITQHAFRYCVGLEKVTVRNDNPQEPNAQLGAYAFDQCGTLKTAVLPNSLTTINSYSFRGCIALNNIILSSRLTSLGISAFSGCSSLTNITIPASVTEIKKNCFSDCTSMEEYHLLPETPPSLAASNAFTNIPAACVIYVPRSNNQAVLNAYKAATNWSTYASQMQEEPQ